MDSTILERENTKRERETREFASAVLTGTVIGRSLRDALQSLSREDVDTGDNNPAAVQTGTPSPDDDDDSGTTGPPFQEILRKPIAATTTTTVTMNGESVDKILQAFREGVAESGIFHHPEKDGAPRAMLKGRCDHYNRYGQNWIVSMDTVKLRARPTKFTKRRRDDRPSLWDRDDDGGRTTSKEIVLDKKLQLLAYGDIA